MTHHCGRCPVDTAGRTPARHHVTAHGYGTPVDEYVCDAHLDDALTAVRRHPFRSAELVTDDGQDALFDLGGGAA
jgi:hypothetical protein